MSRCEAVGSRNMRRMTPTSDGFFGKSISRVTRTVSPTFIKRIYGDKVQVTSALEAFELTIDVLGAVQVDAQYAPIRERENDNVVGDLAGDEVSGE